MFVFLWLGRLIISGLGLFFRGSISSLFWFFSSSLGGAIALSTSVFGAIIGLIAVIKSWIMSLVPLPIKEEASYSFGNSFGDYFDSQIVDKLGDDLMSSVFKDVLYIVQIGELINLIVTIFIPFLISIFLYKLIKSWIPTLSS